MRPFLVHREKEQADCLNDHKESERKHGKNPVYRCVCTPRMRLPAHRSTIPSNLSPGRSCRLPETTATDNEIHVARSGTIGTDRSVVLTLGHRKRPPTASSKRGRVKTRRLLCRGGRFLPDASGCKVELNRRDARGTRRPCRRLASLPAAIRFP